MSAGVKWTAMASASLTDAARCPLCLNTPITEGRCRVCGADLSGPQGAELWAVSTSAAESLRERERLLRELDVARQAALYQGVAVQRPTVTDERGPGATLQSVIATAGAALFAVAAFVFSFFTPEMSAPVPRSLVIGGVALLFVTGAWWLAHRRLQFSAEAVGALGFVFLGLEVHALAQLFTGASPWAAGAIVTAVAGAGMLVAGRGRGIRIWFWGALLALASVPAMAGAAIPGALATSLGWVGVAFAAAGLAALAPGWGRGFTVSVPDAAARGAGSPTRIRAEGTTLAWAQLLATAAAVITAVDTVDAANIALVLFLLAIAAVAAACLRAPRLWMLLAGALATGAAAIATMQVPAASVGIWTLAFGVAGAAAMLIATALVPLPLSVPRTALAVGSASVLAVLSLPPLVSTVVIARELIVFFPRDSDLEWNTWPTIVMLAVIAFALAVFSLVARRDALRMLRPAASVLALAAGGLAVLAATAGAPIAPLAQVAIGLGSTVVIALVLLLTGRSSPAASARRSAGRPEGSAPLRAVPLATLVVAHLVLVVAALVLWREPAFVPVTGALALAVLTLVAFTVSAPLRFFHVAAGYAFALVVFSASLGLAGLSGIPQQCLTASAGLLGAIAATFLPRIAPRNWYAVLIVATVPFGIGIVQVIFERSGWTALSTGLMFVLALSLLLTRRPGLTIVVRTLAAGMLVPTLAVAILCLGAQLLAGSGSPVVLPVVAAMIALVLPSGRMLRTLLIARGRTPRTADAARIAMEVSALVTAAIAVLLSLVREAAGLGTATLVLVLLGVGGVLTALVARRRFGWWLAGLAFAGALQTFRWGTFESAFGDVLNPTGRFLSAVMFAAATALLLIVAGGAVRHARRFALTSQESAEKLRDKSETASEASSRWLFAPAVLAFAVTVWPGIERDWFVIWAMWALMLVLLALTVLAARTRTMLPPVWFLFGIAFVTGIVAWSPRDLRVEWFSLPMGLFLLAAGVIGWRASSQADAASARFSLNRWPQAPQSSWILLAPGIVVAMSASIVATFTDPLTWRAILVMALALAAILVGAARRLAAPFLIGLVVLPIENVFVFSVQFGRGISSMPWWITLALMGAVLLIIAITGERREGAGGVVARIRDLR